MFLKGQRDALRLGAGKAQMVSEPAGLQVFDAQRNAAFDGENDRRAREPRGLGCAIGAQGHRFAHHRLRQVQQQAELDGIHELIEAAAVLSRHLAARRMADLPGELLDLLQHVGWLVKQWVARISRSPPAAAVWPVLPLSLYSRSSS